MKMFNFVRMAALSLLFLTGQLVYCSWISKVPSAISEVYFVAELTPAGMNDLYATIGKMINYFDAPDRRKSLNIKWGQNDGKYYSKMDSDLSLQIKFAFGRLNSEQFGYKNTPANSVILRGSASSNDIEKYKQKLAKIPKNDILLGIAVDSISKVPFKYPIKMGGTFGIGAESGELPSWLLKARFFIKKSNGELVLKQDWAEERETIGMQIDLKQKDEVLKQLASIENAIDPLQKAIASSSLDSLQKAAFEVNLFPALKKEVMAAFRSVGDEKNFITAVNSVLIRLRLFLSTLNKSTISEEEKQSLKQQLDSMAAPLFDILNPFKDGRFSVGFAQIKFSEDKGYPNASVEQSIKEELNKIGSETEYPIFIKALYYFNPSQASRGLRPLWTR